VTLNWILQSFVDVALVVIVTVLLFRGPI